MIKKSTWIFLIIFLLAIGSYWLITGIKPSPETLTTPSATSSTFLINTSSGSISRIRVEDQHGLIFEMARNTSGEWIIIQPTYGTAEQSKASATESQVSALRITNSLAYPPHLVEMGLEVPDYFITLEMAGGEKHEIKIGLKTPTNNGYYVRLDSNPPCIVSAPGIEALVNLLTSPPFPPTMTPATNDMTPTP